MSHDEIAEGMKKAKMAIFDVFTQLTDKEGLDPIIFASAAASVGASIIGSIMPPDKVVEGIEGMMVPMKLDAMKASSKVAPESLWWLSFADDDGFRGAIITTGGNVVEAVAKTHAMGINPGGEVLGKIIPKELENAIAAEERNRLLSKADCDRIDADAHAFLAGGAKN